MTMSLTSPSKACQSSLAIHYILTDEALLEEAARHLSFVLLPIIYVKVRPSSSHFLELRQDSRFSEIDSQNRSLLERALLLLIQTR